MPQVQAPATCPRPSPVEAAPASRWSPPTPSPSTRLLSDRHAAAGRPSRRRRPAVAWCAPCHRREAPRRGPRAATASTVGPPPELTNLDEEFAAYRSESTTWSPISSTTAPPRTALICRRPSRAATHGASPGHRHLDAARPRRRRHASASHGRDHALGLAPPVDGRRWRRSPSPVSCARTGRLGDALGPTLAEARVAA